MQNGKKIENKIHILPEFIANQIAAGEVVQRPESVIKELVENSLDAKADTVVVVVRNAGKQLIHIVDNGTGMNKSDLSICTKRHSTSKVFSVEDLEQIMTFGFRGEALASISSVANIEIRTKQKDDEYGWRLLSEPMKVEIIEPYNADVGTQVFVKNLFYNVPARKKFLSSDLTEFRHISDTMLKFALSHPQIRFTFYDDDTLIFDVHPSDLATRIGKILGDNIVNNILPLETANDLIKISGYIGLPTIAKQSRANQYLFLNGRSIKSKSLSYAVFSAFEHLLEKYQNPFFLLNIELNPKRIDVNIHPQKHEVKFDDERFVFNMINSSVYNTLQKFNLAPEINIREKTAQTPLDTIQIGGDNNTDMMLVNKLTGEVIETNYTYKPSSNYRMNIQQRDFSKFEPSRDNYKEQFGTAGLSAFDEIFGKPNTAKPSIYDSPATEEQSYNQNRIWQLHNKYLLVQTEKGLMIIDQHAAHERILYEKAIKLFNKEMSNSQQLLFPINCSFSSSDIAILKENEEEIKLLGYVFSFEGNNQITVNSVPLDVQSGCEAESLKELFAQFEENQKIETSNKRDNLAASFSCKNAIKTGKVLNNDEAQNLLNNLFKCDNPFSCPHGRPIIVEMSLNELDKSFGRI